MQNFKLTLQFDGTDFHGWQIQHNAVAVSAVLNSAIQKITGEYANIIGCSRTDSGVHALTYMCNFRSETTIPPSKLPFAFNTKLPSSIRVLNCEIVHDDFNSRFNAKSKTYIYKVYNKSIANPFYTNYAYFFPLQLNVDNIKKAMPYFIGKHDFSAFMSAGGSQNTTVREIFSLDFTLKNDIIEFEISANAYLYNMVRIIVGTLLYVGCGKISFDDIPGIILNCDRTKAGITAPPHGLYLKKIDY